MASMFEWSSPWMLKSCIFPMIIRLSSLDIFSVSSSVVSLMNMLLEVFIFWNSWWIIQSRDMCRLISDNYFPDYILNGPHGVFVLLADFVLFSVCHFNPPPILSLGLLYVCAS